MINIDDYKLITIDAVADILGLSVDGVKNLERKGILPYVKLSTNIRRFKLKDVLELIDSRRVS